MVNENPTPPFGEWIGPAIVTWLLVVAVVFLGLGAFSWIMSVLRNGPVQGSVRFFRGLLGAAADLVLLSPRRVAALAWLAFKESLRRKVVVVFAVFLLLIAFGGWFLNPTTVNPARVYISFVLTATTYLICFLVAALAALSLPGDIRQKTIHTVVTKPVRASEIILGRIVGFTVIGTILLAVMCGISYVFVARGLDHSHEVQLSKLRLDEDAKGKSNRRVWRGRTSEVQSHYHDVYVTNIGEVQIEPDAGHWHEAKIDAKWLSDPATAPRSGQVTTGAQEGLLVARVPVYGELAFFDRAGHAAAKGVNTGDEWTYRSYIEGATAAAAIWTFNGITEKNFPHDGLPLEMTLGVFRTHKGTIDKGVPASLTLRNPRTGQSVEAKIFPAKEYVVDMHWLPREMQTGDGRKVDLFRDLTDNGRLEVRLQCLEPGQYFGAAQFDMYLRAADASFTANFVKGYFGVWLKMVILVGFGVMFSTMVGAPVALLANAGAFFGGLFHEFIIYLAQGDERVIGGGTFESLVRILTGDNQVSELEPGLRTTAVKWADYLVAQILSLLAHVLPNFSRFQYDLFVADGFSIPWNTIAVDSLTSAALVFPVFIVGYVLLRSREVAA